ncbi:MAG: DNA alkylation repair protein [Flavobacteriales bacterium]|nr:DNA alkylation repair protein [Flavobacteriales bacterium]NNK81343.1 DNA alkylation repair protein [Flavobacteriales bacterium]
MLRSSLLSNSSSDDATAMKAYMRNKFEFLGIKSKARKITQAPFIKDWLISKQLDKELVYCLWRRTEREMQYVAMDYLARTKRYWHSKDLAFFKELIENKSWWDSVDFLAATCVGGIVRLYPELEKEMDEWNREENLWVIRTSILYQLKYKDEMNEQRLSRFILAHSDSKEFFIQKAAGWILREYAKFNPSWVSDFVRSNHLAPLTQREALKHIG